MQIRINLEIQSYRGQFLIPSQDYVKKPRTQWVKDWPNQIVLCVSKIYWTKEVTEAIKRGPKGMQAYLEKLGVQLNDLVAMIRGQMPKLTQTTFTTLLTIDVHAKDVFEALVKKGR